MKLILQMQIIRLLKILCGRSKATAYGLSPQALIETCKSLTIISGKVRSEVEGPMWPFYALCRDYFIHSKSYTNRGVLMFLMPT